MCNQYKIKEEKGMKKQTAVLFFLGIFFYSFAQGTQTTQYSQLTYTLNDNQIIYRGDRNYSLTERTDLRRYDNGKYKGLMSREIKSFICAKLEGEDYYYAGEFYVNEDTRRGTSYINSGIHESIFSSFYIDKEGNLNMIEDNGYPSFRSFPSYTEEKLKKGDTWEAYAVRVVDPLNKGIFTRMKIYVQYTYLKDSVFNSEEVYEISAKWATRYSNISDDADENGDPELKQAYGSHSSRILVSKKTGTALLVSDQVDETFVYMDGNRYQFKGSISLFTDYPPSVNNEEVQTKVQGIQNIEYEKTIWGLKLKLMNLQFHPDSAVLVDGEEDRLDKIAEVLKTTDSMFLVEGHTARVGSLEGEKELSYERAMTIIKELVKRGIKEDRFICKARGGSSPIDTNETEEGRARNRRVEITILE